MGIITKEVQIKPFGKQINYYKDLGYDVKWGEPLIVNVNNLPRNSKAKVCVECDVCGSEKIISYQNYNNSVENGGYYACKRCSLIKTKESIQKTYGVDNIFQTQECKDKIKSTFNKKYNCDNPMQVPELKEKQKNSLIEHFGVKVPLQNEEIKQRAKNTTFEHYGCYYASQSDEFKETVANTMMEKYNVKYMMHSPELRAKAKETLCKNGDIRTSKQQVYLYNLYGGEINYNVKYHAVDICFLNDRLCIEYDGKGHNLSVTLGNLTQEEFDQKEMVRDRVIKSEGYKIMRIKSKKDKLPSDTILLQMLSDARTYFLTTEHTWIEFNIDTQTIRSAEHHVPNDIKQGVPYDFGELRYIYKL